MRSYAGVETRSIANPYVASGRSRVERRGPYDIATYLGPTDRAVLEAVRTPRVCVNNMSVRHGAAHCFICVSRLDMVSMRHYHMTCQQLTCHVFVS